MFTPKHNMRRIGKCFIILCILIWITIFLQYKSNTMNSVNGSYQNLLLQKLDTHLPQHILFREVGEMLTFIRPGSGLCSQFLLKSNLEISNDMSEFYASLDDRNKMAEFPELRAIQWYLARLPFVRNICGTGFNRGDSVLSWLIANKEAHVYSFDIGKHPYTLPSSKVLMGKYPNRLNFTLGDSTKTLPDFIRKHPDIKCDFIVLNGGHSYLTTKSDHMYFRKMASKRHIILLDDHPNLRSEHSATVGRAWEEQKKNGELLEFAHCTMADLTSGFSLGQYVIE